MCFKFQSKNHGRTTFRHHRDIVFSSHGNAVKAAALDKFDMRCIGDDICNGNDLPGLTSTNGLIVELTRKECGFKHILETQRERAVFIPYIMPYYPKQN